MFATALFLAGVLQAAGPAPAAEKPASEQKVCRRIEVTGSVARKERVCKTRAEWQRLGDVGNANARDIVDWSRGRPSGQ